MLILLGDPMWGPI